MANEHNGRAKGWANVTPLTQRSPEEAAAIRRKGRQGQQREQLKRRTYREICNAIGQLPAPQMSDNELADAAMDAAKARGRKLTADEAVAIAMYAKAAQGDTTAAGWVRDTNGDKPADKVAQDVTLSAADLDLLHQMAGKLAPGATDVHDNR